MGKFQMQKLTRAVVSKDANTYQKPLLFYNFSIFLVLMAAPQKRSKKSKFFSILEIFSKVEVKKSNVCACLMRLIKPDKKKITLDILWWEV
jgi:hypothetical protein